MLRKQFLFMKSTSTARVSYSIFGERHSRNSLEYIVRQSIPTFWEWVMEAWEAYAFRLKWFPKKRKWLEPSSEQRMEKTEF